MPAVAMPPAFAHSPCHACCSQVSWAVQHGAMLVRWTSKQAGAPARLPSARRSMRKLMRKRGSVCTLTPCTQSARSVRTVRARQVSLRTQNVLWAIIYLCIKERAAEEAWLARSAPWKFCTRWCCMCVSCACDLTESKCSVWILCLLRKSLLASTNL